MEDTPARCREKIAQSTDGPEWAMLLLRGGVHSSACPGSRLHRTPEKKQGQGRD